MGKFFPDFVGGKWMQLRVIYRYPGSQADSLKIIATSISGMDLKIPSRRKSSTWGTPLLFQWSELWTFRGMVHRDNAGTLGMVVPYLFNPPRSPLKVDTHYIRCIWG